MKEKAFIWILSLNDGYKPVCVDIWPSKVLFLLFHGLLLGPCFSKVPRTLRARKAIRKSTTCLFCKAGLFICCKGNKNKNNCKVSCLETPSFWRYIENYVTRNTPEKFRDFWETGPRPQHHGSPTLFVWDLWLNFRTELVNTAGLWDRANGSYYLSKKAWKSYICRWHYISSDLAIANPSYLKELTCTVHFSLLKLGMVL